MEGMYSPYYAGRIGIWGAAPLSGSVNGAVDITDQVLALGGPDAVNASYFSIRVLSNGDEDYSEYISGLDTLQIVALDVATGIREIVYQQQDPVYSPIKQCAYMGVYRISPLDGPCSSSYIASGTDDDCDNTEVNLTPVENLGQNLDRIKWSINAISGREPTTIISLGRDQCAYKYLNGNLTTPSVSMSNAIMQLGWVIIPVDSQESCNSTYVAILDSSDEIYFLTVTESCTFDFVKTQSDAQKFKMTAV